MDRYTIADGIVLRRKALPSGDVVVTLLSEHDKWRAIGRKGRMLGGNLGRLSLFHDVRVQYYRRREEDLALLTQVRLNGALPNLSRPDVYPYANLLAELTDQLTTEVQLGGQAYGYLASGLRGLDQHPRPELVALAYAWKMLALAGMAPATRACARCGSTDDLGSFDIEAGGLGCRACGAGVPVSASVAAELHRLNGAGIRGVLGDPPADLSVHWWLLARYLAYHVGELRSLRPLEGGGVLGRRDARAQPGGA